MPNQQEFAQNQLQNLQYFQTGQNPYGGFGGFSPFGASIADRFGAQYKGQPTLSQYNTTPLDEAALSRLIQQYLGGAQSRALGSAGGEAGAYAASRGLSPYAFIQHAQSPIYNQYADLFGKAATEIPELGFRSRLAANEQNFGNLARLMGLQQGYASMLPQQGPGFGDVLGSGLGSIAGSIFGPVGGALGGRIANGLSGGSAFKSYEGI